MSRNLDLCPIKKQEKFTLPVTEVEVDGKPTMFGIEPSSIVFHKNARIKFLYDKRPSLRIEHLLLIKRTSLNKYNSSIKNVKVA